MSVAVLGPVCAFMSSVTWALGSAGYSRLAREHSPFAVNLARGMIGLLLFFLTALAAGALETHSVSGAWSAFSVLDARHIGWLGLSMFASYGFGDSVFLMSTRALGIPTALTIASTYPLITSAWGAFVDHEWLSVTQTAGLLVTVAGVAFVILSAPRPTQTDSHANDAALKRPSRSTGFMLAFFVAFLWALNSYCVTRGGQGITAPVGNTVRMTSAVLLCLIIGKVAYPKERITLPQSVFRRWGWLFVLEAFGGSYFFVFGLAHSSIAVGSTLVALAPVISVPVALALRLETFSWKRTAAVITVVFGLFLLVSGAHS
ncbi:MAG: EamA family transporter [Bdellovibrionia bacterium]